MAIWPFNRKKSNVLPEEVQEYYQSTNRERTGVAWLLAFGTLLLTIVLAVVLFFGGRAIYRLIVGNDKPESTVQVQPEDTKTDANSDSDAKDDKDSTSSTDNTTTLPGDDSDGSATDEPEAPTTDETPTTGPTEAEIPDTGPGPGGLQ